jgi:DNA-nicking Smr family endonuclease
MTGKSDDELFHRALADVKPLKRGVGRIAKPKAARGKPVPESVVPPLSTPRPAPRLVPPPVALPPAQTALDRRTSDRLRRGQVGIDATLDLHGMILRDAEPALSRFLAQAQALGRRAVLVVTGKGTKIDPETGRIKEGAIRRELPHWLDAAKNRHRIIGYRAAHARHGGGGAFYVLIRRVR